jgi:flagellar P-ring protein precursor FlgI
MLAAILLAWMGLAAPALAVRVKDVTHLQGVRDNQLIGYGLVVGLNGTGDSQSTKFTQQTLAAFLRRNNLTIDPTSINIDNIASVVVTATLPPFSRTGNRIDVLVSSIGDAENLQGGTLLMTQLMGADGQVYAVAQGALSTGGFDAGAGGTSVSKNHPTAAKVPAGALIEREPPTQLAGRSELTLTLDNPDFTTARRVAEAINGSFPGVAQALDNSAVRLAVPGQFASKLADYIAEIERLPVHPDQRARIVMDEKSGTIIMGEDVRISTLAIAHGSLSVQIAQTNQVSQPEAFGIGLTTPFSNVDVSVQEENRALAVVSEGVSLGEVVQGLNAIGVTPRDLISILQLIRAGGYMQAELEIR